MKILHINSYFNSSNFYKNLYDKQIEKGLNIKVYVPIQTSNKNCNRNWEKYTIVSKAYNKLDRLSFSNKRKKIYKDINNVINLYEFSLVHAHSLFSNGYIAYKLKKGHNLPYVVAVRNSDINVFFKRFPFLRKLGLKILKSADRIIFLSESYKEFLIDKYVPANLKKQIGDKALVIPNGIDDFWFKNIGFTKVAPSDKKLNLLFVGDINKNKNLLKTIEAIKILIKKNYKVHLNLVGKIKSKKIYKKISKLPFVTYNQPKPKEDLLEMYRENDIFVMPSKTETFGLVYGEAISQGVPVIYTKGQGFDRQFQEGKVGHAVLPYSGQDIADKIELVVNNYTIISERCLHNVDKFNWESIESKYREIYIKTLSSYM